MKVVPLIHLPPSAPAERLPLPLPFNPSDLMMRYGPSGQWLTELHLPPNLASDPRLWSREDVAYFLRWCETEFDLPNFDMDLFQMNGKALCFLTKSDLNERCSGSGGLLHNILQLLIRETGSAQRGMPTSPLTPTSRGTRYPFPSLPYSNWYLSELYNAHNAAMLNSATLSPAPSTDSTSRSPDHSTDNQASSGFGSGGSTGSHHSDSEEEPYVESSPPAAPPAPPGSPPGGEPPPRTPTQSAQTHRQPQHFFPSDLQPEPNTNGRLLWDFLQQLLNDPGQRYTSFIAWKNHETGVFKIVDPSGLARLWGIQKNHLSMNYDKMSRALRYYYRVNILRKVQGERHCYQFLRNPSELKSIKNISLLRQQIALQKQRATTYNGVSVKPDPDANEPTDLTTMQPQMGYSAVKPDSSACDTTELKTRPSVRQPISLQTQFKQDPCANEPTDLSTTRSSTADHRDRSVFARDRSPRSGTLEDRDRCETMHVSIVKSE